METNRLKQFTTIIETGSLREAAEILNISHGALSKSIKVLEVELGFSLFSPKGRGIEPTEKALNIYEKSKDVIKSIQNLQKPIDEINSKKIKIATFEVFSTYFLSTLSPILDDIEMELHETRQGELENAVLKKHVDFGITYEPIPTAGVEYLNITKVKMGTFGVAKFLKQTPENYPFVIPRRPIHGAPSGVTGLDGWPDHKFIRNIKFKVDMLESALSLVRHGHAVAFLPEFIAKSHNEIVKTSFKLQQLKCPKNFPIISRKVFIVKRVSSEESAEMKKISRWLRKIK